MRDKRATESKRIWILLASSLTALLVATFAVACAIPGVVGDGGTLPTSAGDTATTTSADTATTASGDTATTASTGQQSTTTTVASADTMTVRVYFSRDEKMAAATRVVPRSLQTGAAAIKALLQGPTAQEQEAGMVSCIPSGTTYLGLDIKDGVATVDLSQEYGSGGGSLSMFTRIAQVVFTLTQFPTVDGVRFKLDGKLIDALGGEGIIVDEPVGRSDYEDMSPAILVETPTLGATVKSPMRVTGTANVFEAVFQINIVDWDGRIIAEKTVMATSGTGTRGTFDVTVPFSVDKAGLGALIVFAESPKDGSQIDVVEIPLQLAK